MFMEMLDKILRTAKEQRLNQGELERAARLSANRISKLKKQGGDLSAGEVYRVARVLGVSTDYLLDESLTSPKTAAGLTEEQARVLMIAETLGYGVALSRLLKSEPEVIEWETDKATRRAR